MRLTPSSTFDMAVMPAMIQQSPRLPCLTSPPSIFCIKVGFSKISCTRLTALGTAAFEPNNVALVSSNLEEPRVFRQLPLRFLRSQS